MTKLDKATEKADDYQKNQPNRTWKGENENTEDVNWGRGKAGMSCETMENIFETASKHHCGMLPSIRRRTRFLHRARSRSAGEPSSFDPRGPLRSAGEPSSFAPLGPL
jgi:hypothetical protein